MPGQGFRVSDLPLQPEHLAFAGAGPLCAACEHEEGAADDGDDCDDGSLGSLAGRDEQDAEEQMRAAAPRDPHAASALHGLGDAAFLPDRVRASRTTLRLPAHVAGRLCPSLCRLWFGTLY